jgi:hypothetical protein
MEETDAIKDASIVPACVAMAQPYGCLLSGRVGNDSRMAHRLGEKLRGVVDKPVSIHVATCPCSTSGSRGWAISRNVSGVSPPRMPLTMLPLS